MSFNEWSINFNIRSVMIGFWTFINFTCGVVFLIYWGFDIQFPEELIVLMTLSLCVSVVISLYYLFTDEEGRLLCFLSLLFVFFSFALPFLQKGEIFEVNGKYGIRESIRRSEVYAPVCDTIIERLIVGKAWRYQDEDSVYQDKREIFLVKVKDKYGMFLLNGNNANIEGEEIIPVTCDSIIVVSKIVSDSLCKSFIDVLTCYKEDSVFVVNCYGNVPADTIQLCVQVEQAESDNVLYYPPY